MSKNTQFLKRKLHECMEGKESLEYNFNQKLD